MEFHYHKVSDSGGIVIVALVKMEGTSYDIGAKMACFRLEQRLIRTSGKCSL